MTLMNLDFCLEGDQRKRCHTAPFGKRFETRCRRLPARHRRPSGCKPGCLSCTTVTLAPRVRPGPGPADRDATVSAPASLRPATQAQAQVGRAPMLCDRRRECQLEPLSDMVARTQPPRLGASSHAPPDATARASNANMTLSPATRAGYTPILQSSASLARARSGGESLWCQCPCSSDTVTRSLTLRRGAGLVADSSRPA